MTWSLLLLVVALVAAGASLARVEGTTGRPRTCRACAGTHRFPGAPYLRCPTSPGPR